MEIHPAIHKMTSVVNLASTNPIEHYMGDLVHDGYALAGYDPDMPFVWFLRKCGTHIAKDTEFFNAVVESSSFVRAYHWTGKELVELEDPIHSPFEA